ncbi:MAG TPA: MmcQ/YjbR family DNA-binding protein [Rhizomicrobium sp.]|nr:MmcQ/YjbR family DNA-binding protein [Rhizomicrobium sp.]
MSVAKKAAAGTKKKKAPSRRAPARTAKRPAAAKGKTGSAVARLRAFALTFPEATEEHPWGETAIKVKGRIFVFLGKAGLSVKLPRSRDFALDYPFTRPTPYGLGRSAWVSADIRPDGAPLAVLRAWIAESYRAVAPKKLAAVLPMP